MKTKLASRKAHYLVKVCVFLIAVALIVGMVGCTGSTVVRIRDWYDLDAVRDNLGGRYILMNDLDSSTAGYETRASPTANGRKGWQPIGDSREGFSGRFDGQGYEISDLFIDRPDENKVGLFAWVEDGIIEDICVTDVNIIGYADVGALAGSVFLGSISNSYATGNVIGDDFVGGLVGYNYDCTTMSDSHFTGNVTGGDAVGGLMGGSESCIVTDCYSAGSVTGGEHIGGLMGISELCSVTNSYFTGNVTGGERVGGLVGVFYGQAYEHLSNSYSTGSVSGNISVGGLVGENLGRVMNSYSTGSVIGNYYIGGLVGENRGGMVRNSYSTGNVTGNNFVGGLAGDNYDEGTVSNSFWDIETSGQATSDGGIGKITTEMKDITIFSGAGWNIIAVALNETSPAYTWNIVNNVTYAFLGWQS